MSKKSSVDSFALWVAGILVGGIALSVFLTRALIYGMPLHDKFVEEMPPHHGSAKALDYLERVLLPSSGQALWDVLIVSAAAVGIGILLLFAFQPIFAPKHTGK
ncbi:MAG: hypothetical protein RL150_174 [Candidatus Parcubacteria bacterium]|jgi:hypothetical protein